MMSDQKNQFDSDPHQAVWELLPWYVNDTLEGPERNRVRDHISECQRCEEEVGRCRTIADVVRSGEVAEWSPSPERVDRMMARIDGEGAVSNRETRGIYIHEWLEKIRFILQETPSSLRWVLAAQTTVIVLLAAAVILQSLVAPSSLYRTLSDTGAGSEPGTLRIQVIFADNTTEQEIRTLLSSVGATIVAGPSPMAIYTLAVTPHGPDAAAGTGQTLAVLREHPKVRLAEPKEP